MKTKLTMMVAMAAACVAVQLTAMPPAEDTKRAEPVVRKLLASERAALKSGKKTRSEVADAAMKLADEADSDAAKLLLMKGAFVLYVRDGYLKKAVETMNALEATIADMPPQSVTNMIETALLGVSRKVDGAWLYKLLDETKKIGTESVALKAGTHKRLEIAEGKKAYGGYTWSYRVGNGEAMLVAEKDGRYSCAVSPTPTGRVSIPPTLNYIKLTSIGCQAFRECKGLTSVTIPSSVKVIGTDAFKACYGLRSVTIPGSVKSIGRGAFFRCGGLTEVTIQQGVEAIGQGVFSYCTNLTSVTIPSSVTNIDTWAISDCSRLKSVTILGDVKKIGRQAIWNCPELTSVTICGERPEAPNDVFEKCGKLKSIHVPANAKSWAGMKEWQDIPLVFDDGKGVDRQVKAERGDAPTAAQQQQATVDGYTWSYRVKNGEATIVAEKDGKYSCAVSPTPTGDVSIPATLGGVKVTRIGWEAFRNCKGLTSVTIPEGVTYIDYNAFSHCGLKSVTLPSSLKVIGWAAFGKCAELTSVEIPNGVKSIEPDAFNGCTGLKSVVIPENVTRIGHRAFLCSGLESVTIPVKVVHIDEGAFGGCRELKQINLAAGNQSFTLVDGVLYTKDMSVLLACPGTMTSVTIPSAVTRIGAFSFRACNRLTSVTIPESVKAIGPVAFKECYGLQSVTICGERPEAPNDVFEKCGKLKSIHVPAKAKSWAGMKEWQGIPLVFDAK